MSCSFLHIKSSNSGVCFTFLSPQFVLRATEALGSPRVSSGYHISTGLELKKQRRNSIWFTGGEKKLTKV